MDYLHFLVISYLHEVRLLLEDYPLGPFRGPVCQCKIRPLLPVPIGGLVDDVFSIRCELEIVRLSLGTLMLRTNPLPFN